MDVVLNGNKVEKRRFSRKRERQLMTKSINEEEKRTCAMCIVLNADMKKEAINFEIKLRRQITREKLGRNPKYENSWFQVTISR